MSPASHFFFVPRKKNPFANVVNKHVPNFQSCQKNSHTVFRQSDSRIILRFLSYACVNATNAISHLLHATHAINAILHATNATNAISHAINHLVPPSGTGMMERP